MKQYVIDQLRESDYDRIRNYLTNHAESAAMEGIYYVDLPDTLYTDLQKSHDQCQPYYFAVNLTRKQVGFEWLIRSRNTLRCACIGYATQEQRDYIIDYADGILDRLRIKL